MTTEALLDFAIARARLAGEVMREYYHKQDKGTETKADMSPVTEADKLINDELIAAVKAECPDYGVLGEEASWQREKSELWVCDPIDGTVAFISGLTTSAYSLAFVVDGVPQVAVLYDPFMDRMLTAIKGRGTSLNGMQVRVSTKDSVVGARISFAGGAKTLLNAQDMFAKFMDNGSHLTLTQGNVYKSMLVGEGKLDGYFFGGTGAYDIAAAKLIVEEAGGKVTDLNGNEQRYDEKIFGAVISNGQLHEELLEAVKQFGPQRYLDA